MATFDSNFLVTAQAKVRTCPWKSLSPSEPLLHRIIQTPPRHLIIILINSLGNYCSTVLYGVLRRNSGNSGVSTSVG
jgi:hypothetical protein